MIIIKIFMHSNNCEHGYVTALLHCPNQFCLMRSHSNVTEALRRQLVQMKSSGPLGNWKRCWLFKDFHFDNLEAT